MIIEYYKKNVYGIERTYIKDEKLEQVIVNLTGQKTLSESAMEALKELGVEFRQVLP